MGSGKAWQKDKYSMKKQAMKTIPAQAHTTSR